MPASAILTLRANNPGPFTGAGTNTYILGGDEVVVVDPGPDVTAHLAAILAAIAGRRVAAILVTHAHLDHTALVPRLAHLTWAEVLAFGGAEAGISPLMRQLAAEGLTGGEGCDHSFVPDRTVVDGQILHLAGAQIQVIHTPGHMGNHICLALDDTLLSGDHVMGWSTSIVSPPEGDMGAYMRSLAKLTEFEPKAGNLDGRNLDGRNPAPPNPAPPNQATDKPDLRHWAQFLPGHGAPITDPMARLSELIAHRLGREAAIVQALSASGAATAIQLALHIYTTTPPALLPAAARNVLAHLIDLQSRGVVNAAPDAEPRPFIDRRFALGVSRA